ncbi:NAD synthetase [Cutibacterium acnes JCM 18918]|nr:NAD synthetase [Cutibacterium acnes JCM 18918]
MSDGYAIDDLLLQDVVLDAVLDAIETVRQASRSLFPVIIVGAPLQRGNRLYNCAVVIHRGQVLGVVPKSHLPTIGSLRKTSFRRRRGHYRDD